MVSSHPPAQPTFTKRRYPPNALTVLCPLAGDKKPHTSGVSALRAVARLTIQIAFHRLNVYRLIALVLSVISLFFSESVSVLFIRKPVIARTEHKF